MKEIRFIQVMKAIQRNLLVVLGVCLAVVITTTTFNSLQPIQELATQLFSVK